ncbi:IS66 family transposase [Candidatus Cardinium hertigii]|uniref:Transposase IS66 central domain-containing protein n=1 Tax=Candidatus Cardinium hertigii TaxID=247481 RepID=A0A3N2QBM3_9BACT|nr:transposase [Candidatus Cardinium hertigii]ROT47170.1 hypothetical protein EDM02_03315 [Candidatus Cardinium hertigii]
MVADSIVAVPLDNLSCSCGGDIRCSKTPTVHQKVDLPDIKPYVIDYHLQNGRCKKCGKRRTADLPPNVTSDIFGPRTKSVITALTGFYKNSKREVADILKDICNLPISLGTISNSEGKVSSKCAASYQTIVQKVSQSNLLHIDETSHYTKGKLGWCWLFTNQVGSVLKLTPSRGMYVLKNSAFAGLLKT